MPDNEQVPELISLQEAADILQVSTRYLRDHWREWGGTKIGRLKFFKDLLLQRFEAEREKAERSVALHDAKGERAQKTTVDRRARSHLTDMTKRYSGIDRHNLFAKIVQCGAITRNGTPCKLKALEGHCCPTHGGPIIYSNS